MRARRAVVVATIFAVASSAALAAPATPRLTVVGTEPLVVRGVSFRPGERVVVTAMTLVGPRRSIVKASGSGSFRASLRLYTQPCGRAFAVRAVGAAGSRALAQLRSEPCVPPPRD